MNDQRPDPEVLLSRVKAEESRLRRGRLKIFFGYAAGVGKTYAMLEAAHVAKSSGREVVIGYVELHGRKNTEALLEGLEVIPTRQIIHHGVTLREFDVDAALKRRPELILVDELAHTNAPGSRHAQRWQDIFELLDEGMDVWTTLNVQHIESLNDVVGQITGIVVRETIPDDVFDQADDLELIDLSPEELIVRLREGKVYLTTQAERAMQNFFQKSNLVALRELSMRQAARRVHSELESERRHRAVRAPWATNDRLLVCVGPSPTTTRVIRTAKRLATALDAPWVAVCVEQIGTVTSPAAAQQVADHLRLAERLGAETITLTGGTVGQTILDYARAQNVTKVLIGKSHRPRWRRLLVKGVVEHLLEHSGEIDVYVIQGKEEPRQELASARAPMVIEWSKYLAAIGIVAMGSILAALLSEWRVAESNVIMVFLAAVAFVAFRLGRGPSILASVAAVFVFDFFFVPPRLSITVDDTQYLLTFAVMLAIGLLISTLTARLRSQIDRTTQRERRTLALHQLGKQLSSLSGEVFLVSAAGQHLREMVGGEVAIYMRRRRSGDDSTLPTPVFGQQSRIVQHPVSGPTAHWVIAHDQIAGHGTDTLPNAIALFIPLTGSQDCMGAIAVQAPSMEWLLQPAQRQWFENCANQLALALERDRMVVDAADARIQAESEKVRSTLLSSVSHDLKTPLSAIAGAASTLQRIEPAADGTRRELLETIAEEASRLNGLLDNILQISRYDSGVVQPNRQWHVLEEIVGSAIARTRSLLARRSVEVKVPHDLPLVFVDGILMEQVLINLLENAARYTPETSCVMVRAAMTGNLVELSVSDNGPGLPAGSEKLVFERFYRATLGVDSGRGSGLGLAICRAIVELHGGTIEARNVGSGGAEFMVKLPQTASPPPMPLA